MKYGLVRLMRLHFGPDWFRNPVETPFFQLPTIDWSNLLHLPAQIPPADSSPDSAALAVADDTSVAAEEEQAAADLLDALFGPAPGAADAPPAALDLARIFAVLTELELPSGTGLAASAAVFPLDQPPI